MRDFQAKRAIQFRKRKRLLFAAVNSARTELCPICDKVLYVGAVGRMLGLILDHSQDRKLYPAAAVVIA